MRFFWVNVEIFTGTFLMFEQEHSRPIRLISSFVPFRMRTRSVESQYGFIKAKMIFFRFLVHWPWMTLIDLWLTPSDPKNDLKRLIYGKFLEIISFSTGKPLARTTSDSFFEILFTISTSYGNILSNAFTFTLILFRGSTDPDVTILRRSRS